MRFPPSQPTFLSLIALLFFATHTSDAKPYPKDVPILERSANASLELRQSCAVPCGYYNQLCCSSNQVCVTDSNNQAQCSDSQQPAAVSVAGGGVGGGGNGGQWQMYTTTYVETDLVTVTTTYSLPVGGGGGVTVASPQETTFCDTTMGSSMCGGTCCTPGQFCSNGVCIASGASTPGAFVPSAPTRPTSQTVATVVSTGTATTTLPFQTPIGTDGSALTAVSASQTGGGLSGGAIAGIVIGVLFGLLLLFLLCAFLCCRAVFDAIFGRNKRRETTTYMESHHHHHGGAPPPRRWFGALPGRADRPQRKTSGGGLLGVGALLGTLAVLLGLKRRRDRRDEKSSYTGSSYTYSDYTSASE